MQNLNSGLVAVFETNGFTALVTAVSTLLAAYITGRAHDKSIQKRLEKSTRAMIGAEVKVILHLIETNDYLAETKRILTEIKSGKLKAAQISAERGFFKVYEGNLDKLGYLGCAAANVVKFYAYCQATLEDVEQGLEALKNADNAYAKNRPDLVTHWRTQLIKMHESMVQKLELAIKFGESALIDLNFSSVKPVDCKDPVK